MVHQKPWFHESPIFRNLNRSYLNCPHRAFPFQVNPPGDQESRESYSEPHDQKARLPVPGWVTSRVHHPNRIGHGDAVLLKGIPQIAGQSLFGYSSHGEGTVGVSMAIFEDVAVAYSHHQRHRSGGFFPAQDRNVPITVIAQILVAKMSVDVRIQGPSRYPPALPTADGPLHQV